MAAKKKVLTGPLILLLTITSGFAIGNMYWAQPLLAEIATYFGVEVSSGGYLVTATQIGYMLGILFIVPLGDIIQRRKLITTVMILSTGALLFCALSPSFIVLAFALCSLGLTTVSGQIIMPLVRDLADPSERGKVVGYVSSGITLGVLLARSISGLVADFLGWHAIYFIAAIINVLLMLLLHRSIPETPQAESLPYRKLIAGVFTAVVRFKVLPWILIVTGITWGIVFNLFWTALTFLLAGDPYNYNTFQIGLVSLVGLTGSIGALWIGRLQDKGYGVIGTGIFVFICLLSMVLAIFGEISIWIIIIVTAVFSLANQAAIILSQTRVLHLAEGQSSRLNTVFVVNNFIYAALGSVSATLLWNLGGWLAVTLGATIACIIAFLVWLITRDKQQASDDEARKRDSLSV